MKVSQWGNSVAGCLPTSVSTVTPPMSEVNAFVDSNVVLYLLSADPAKTDRSQALPAGRILQNSF